MVLNKKDLERAFSPRSRNRRSLRGTPLSSEMSTKCSNMKVFVRCRPPNTREMGENFRSVVKVIDDKLLIFDPKEDNEPFFFHGVQQKARDVGKKVNKEMQFTYDRVFNGSANNQEVYEATTKHVINSLLAGYNCSVFVYGATGAGKTFTMLGSKEEPGITYLTMEELYRQVDLLKAKKNIQLGISYLEVYNENVHDLIHKVGPLHLREDPTNGVTVAGLKVEAIRDPQQLFEMLEQGNRCRTQHPTDANAESSRSHAVFQVYVRMTSKETGQLHIVKLSMIDLAGSERGLATGCAGMRFKEGSNINKSLLALGNCINNLADGLRHIPYRDSKLTRLLKDSLGGNCHTIMIANVSPSSSSYEDTYNTLKYATRAKKIKSQVKQNIVNGMSNVTQYVKIVEDMKSEIESLKAQLSKLTKPDISNWVDSLERLFNEKKNLHCELLQLQSKEMIFNLRSQFKSFSYDHFKNHLFGERVEGLTRIETSLSQFEGRAEGLRGKMSETWLTLQKNNTAISDFLAEAKTANVYHLISEKLQTVTAEMEAVEVTVQFQHLKLINQLRQNHIEKLEATVNDQTELLKRFYVLLRGNLSENMETEYQLNMRMHENRKGVRWGDLKSEDEECDPAKFSLINGPPFSLLSIDDLHNANSEAFFRPSRALVKFTEKPVGQLGVVESSTQEVDCVDADTTITLPNAFGDVDLNNAFQLKGNQQYLFPKPNTKDEKQLCLAVQKGLSLSRKTTSSTLVQFMITNKENQTVSLSGKKSNASGLRTAFSVNKTPCRPVLGIKQTNIKDHPKALLSSQKMVRIKSRPLLSHPYLPTSSGVKKNCFATTPHPSRKGAHRL